MTRLEARTRSALESGGTLWFDGLAADLTKAAWSAVTSAGVTPDTYSAARFMGDSRAGVSGPVMASLDWGHPVRLEPFDGLVATTYGPLGLWAADRELAAALEVSLADAMQVLDPVAGAADAVKAVVWSVVPVAVEDPAYDTGFSDPAVPFTVILGAHDPSHHIRPIRLAEGLLHEAMHLQLSLIEAVVPLVAGDTHLQHSPWQDRPRPTQGLLHGLYVFRVVEAVFAGLLERGLLSPEDAAHARRRIAQIREECADLAGLSESVDLTDVGRAFLGRLLA